MKIFVKTFLFVLLISTIASAFDGERQGFVIGGGAGFAPMADWQIKGFSSVSEKSSGLAVNLFAGYAFDDNFMIVLQRDGVFHKTFTITDDEENIFQGFTGIVLYYYFNDIGKSFFLTSGIGLQNFTILEKGTDKYSADFGFLIGGGYEFIEHLQIYSSFSYGQTKTTFEFEHTQLMVTLSFVTF